MQDLKSSLAAKFAQAKTSELGSEFVFDLKSASEKITKDLPLIDSSSHESQNTPRVVIVYTNYVPLAVVAASAVDCWDLGKFSVCQTENKQSKNNTPLAPAARQEPKSVP